MRKNTLKQLAMFPIGKILTPFFHANKAKKTVFPLTVLEHKHSEDAKTLPYPVPSEEFCNSGSAHNKKRKLMGHHWDQRKTQSAVDDNCHIAHCM